MKIGYAGIGKLGLPVAVATNAAGHDVYAYDPSPGPWQYLNERKVPYKEEGLQSLLDAHNIQHTENIFDLVSHADIIFVPVQTPHDPEYEGLNIMPGEYKDFDYSFLKEAVREISLAAGWLKKNVTVTVISTVLPGTMEREVYPLLNQYVDFVYNPYFIAMSTVIPDYLDPEFVLVGADDQNGTGVDTLKKFYATIHDKPVYVTDVKSAELIKVSYNLFISMKIVYANTMMEICEKTGANVDAVSDALSMATDRIVSSRYLRGGMGDSGGCHPRDLIAMSWLEQQLDLSVRPFEFMTRAREKQTKWLMQEFHKERYNFQGATRFGNDEKPPMRVLGYAYKKNVNLTTGSCAILMDNMSFHQHTMYDPYVDEKCPWDPETPGIYFIGMNHDVFKEYSFAPGSIVVDPWGIIDDREGVEVRRIGRQG